MQRRLRTRLGVAGIALAAAATGLVALSTTQAANAAPAPAAPIPVYTENFENGVANTPVLLTNYTGASGVGYTADPSWLTGCNGDVLSSNTTPAGSTCTSTGDFDRLQELALALGEQAGESAAAAANNHVVAAYTENNPGAGAIEFHTTSDVTLPATNFNGRFLTFSVDAAAQNCYASGPEYQFSLIDGSVSTDVGGVINPCGSSNSTAPLVGTYTSNGSILFHGSTLGVSMANENGSGIGNDAAFDNIKVLDATPSLFKSFVGPAKADQPDPLTFTITNTSELAAKSGFSFTDTLPAGMTVSAAPNSSSTCGSPSVTAGAGDGAISVVGSLAGGQASCTVTVDVTAPGGNYSNGSGNITSSDGVVPPSTPATVTYDTPPTESVTGGTFFQGQPNVTTAYSCGDQFGTVTSCTAADGAGNPVANGAPLDTSHTGSTGVTVTATNDAGQTTSTSVTYKVVPVVGLCRGTPISVGALGLTLAPGTANPGTSPCKTDSQQVVSTKLVLTPAIPLLGIPANGLTIGALTGASQFAQVIAAGGAAAEAQIADVTINLLGTSIRVTGLTSSASSQLTSCDVPATLSGASSVATVTINGVPQSGLQNASTPVTLPLGIGTIAFNQTVKSGNTITVSAFHLNVAGLADVALGQSVAGAVCGS
jgi:hypothetical protein